MNLFHTFAAHCIYRDVTSTTDAESVHHFVLSTNLRLTLQIQFCNINLYINKCIHSKRHTPSVPAPTLITNLMDRWI
jgi:hypothetical protein